MPLGVRCFIVVLYNLIVLFYIDLPVNDIKTVAAEHHIRNGSLIPLIELKIQYSNFIVFHFPTFTIAKGGIIFYITGDIVISRIF